MAFVVIQQAVSGSLWRLAAIRLASKPEERTAFLKKKKQKTFASSGCGPPGNTKAPKNTPLPLLRERKGPSASALGR
jgi:hypothetical protein